MTLTHVITGSFGAGKTTAIRRLMAAKPAQELWVVVLNEFTELGLDALNVAQSSSGHYDIRLVAGGCLCCVGELEFGKQIRDILRNLKPVRLIIEPSGAGHAADIVDELARYQAQRALELCSVVCLVDALDAQRIAGTRAGNEWSQIQACDVLLLSKSDLAQGAKRQAFEDIAAAQFPPKAFVGECLKGDLPPEALASYARTSRFTRVTAGPRSLGAPLPSAGVVAHTENPVPGVGPAPAADSTSESGLAAASLAFAIAGLEGEEWHTTRLGYTAVGWIVPPALVFSRALIEPRLDWLHQTYGASLRRFKAVLRTGPGPSWQLQSAGRGLSSEDSAYRRDSRLELVFDAPPSEEHLAQWRTLLRDAAMAGTPNP